MRDSLSLTFDADIICENTDLLERDLWLETRRTGIGGSARVNSESAVSEQLVKLHVTYIQLLKERPHKLEKPVVNHKLKLYSVSGRVRLREYLPKRST